jgi:hypothetical protein
MSTDRDQTKLIAERVTRRINETVVPSSAPRSPAAPLNGGPVREELSAIRAGLHDLEGKLDRIESKIVYGGESAALPRARVIDFVSSGPPVVKSPELVEPTPTGSREPSHPMATTSPWLTGLSGQYQAFEQSAITNPQSASHPSQERFGVQEAAVSELVEFFENEKKCSVDPSGKPCDHCAMCSSRGF